MNNIQRFIEELNILEKKYNIEIQEWVNEEWDEGFDGEMFLLDSDSGLRLIDKTNNDEINIIRDKNNNIIQE